MLAKFERANRYANFGAVINRLEVSGFRGINGEIDFSSPITAITGFNGAGKSTIGQLCLCAYKVPSTSKLGRRYYVKDFFPFSAADPAPFTIDALAKFSYQTDKINEDQALTVSRGKIEWSGYKRQPERNCFYVGFTLYIPKVERRDMSIYSSSKIQLTEKREFEKGTEYLSRILGSAYQNVHFQGIKHKDRIAELGIASRFGYQYSENNMGFGEGRAVYMAHLLGTSPEQSLFVIEEPETSLHENAQHELIKYFFDVVDRRHHQIIITTHSSTVMGAIPPAGRKFMHRDHSGVKIFDRFSANRVRSALSGGHDGRTIFCVEDDFAATFVTEILRMHDMAAIKSVSFVAAGDTKAVIAAKQLFDKANIKAIAIRDADVGPDEARKIFSLPGNEAPEKEIFSSPEVRQKLLDEFGVDLPSLLAANSGVDHHDIVKLEHIPAQ